MFTRLVSLAIPTTNYSEFNLHSSQINFDNLNPFNPFMEQTSPITYQSPLLCGQMTITIVSPCIVLPRFYIIILHWFLFVFDSPCLTQSFFLKPTINFGSFVLEPCCIWCFRYSNQVVLVPQVKIISQFYVTNSLEKHINCESWFRPMDER